MKDRTVVTKEERRLLLNLLNDGSGTERIDTDLSCTVAFVDLTAALPALVEKGLVARRPSDNKLTVTAEEGDEFECGATAWRLVKTHRGFRCLNVEPPPVLTNPNRERVGDLGRATEALAARTVEAGLAPGLSPLSAEQIAAVTPEPGKAAQSKPATRESLLTYLRMIASHHPQDEFDGPGSTMAWARLALTSPAQIAPAPPKRRRVISVRWPWGQTHLLSGIWVETDEATESYGPLGPDGFALVVEVRRPDRPLPFFRLTEESAPPEPLPYDDRLYINLRPHVEAIHRAITEVVLLNLEVERVTVVGGKVGAHPAARDHYRCPSCYPPPGL